MFTLNDGENDFQFFIFSRSVIKVSYNH
jgi:hypothetical protein